MDQPSYHAQSTTHCSLRMEFYDQGRLHLIDHFVNVEV